MKRTLAAATTAATAGASIWLAAAPAYAQPGAHETAQPSGHVWVRPATTYAGGGRFAIMAWCSAPRDARVILTPVLPHAVEMPKTGPLEVAVTGKTKPGTYSISLLCVNSHRQTEAMDTATVTIQLRLKGWKQHWQSLPANFRPAATVNSGPPAPPKPRPGTHPKGH